MGGALDRAVGGPPKLMLAHSLCQRWSVDELFSIAELLGDPFADSDAFCVKVNELVEKYKPSSIEIAEILRATLGIKWISIQGDFRFDLLPDSENFELNLRQILDRIKKKWPLRIRWDYIHACKQKPGESVDEYFERLVRCFELYSGVDTEDVAYSTLLKPFILGNMLPVLSERVKLTCIDLESKGLDDLISLCRNVEEVERLKQQSAKEKNARVLLAAQLRYYAQMSGGKGRLYCFNCREKGHHFRQCSIQQCLACGDSDHVTKFCGK